MAITLEIAKRIGVPKIFLIANRVPPELDPESFRGNLEKTYGLPVIGVLPFSYGLMMSQSKTICCHTSANDSIFLSSFFDEPVVSMSLCRFSHLFWMHAEAGGEHFGQYN